MINLAGIPQFTGDFDQLDKDVSALRSDAIGIRDGGSDVHSRFQMLEAFYSAPEAETLFATTQPVMDKADTFAASLETVADALDTFSIEARPLAKRLDQLKTDALAFVNSVEGDDDWTEDEDKVDKNRQLLDDVTAAQSAFREAERRAATKISAIVGGPRFVADDGSGLVERGTVLYGYDADLFEGAEKLPWGTPEDQTHESWSLGWFGHGAKSLLWDGIYKDGFEATAKGVWALATGDGDAWSGLKDVVTGIGLYTMKPYDAFMDWAVGPDEESADEARAKKATKEFGKALVAWDMWQENPTRAAGTVIFNVLTLGAGPLAIASKASKGGVAGRTAGVAAKAGMFMDPVYIGLRATGTTVSAVPKLSELTSRIMGATGTAADAQRVHSVIELEDGSKVVIENGEFIPYDKHGDVVSDRPKQERSANAETMPEQTPVRERELAGVSAASRAPEASAGAGDRLPHQASHEASSGHGSGDTTRSTGPVSGRAGATHAGGAGTPAPGHDSASNSRGRTGSGATSSVGRDGRGPEPAAGAGGSETGSPHSSAHHHEARADTQEPHQGHDVLDAADGEGGTPSATHPHSGSAGDGGPAQGELLPGTARRTLREMRAMNHSRDRYKGAEDYVREMTGGAPERHYRVPSHDHPYYPVHGTGGRNVDVPVDMPDGRTLAVEVKHYLEWRTLKLSDGSTRPVKGEVPLNDGIIEQINKDLTLRRQDPTYDPRWVFLHAPPSQALRNYLIQARVIFIEYGPAPK